MTEEQMNLLKEKLKLFFDNKLEALTNKFESDINLIEQLKLNVYDNIIIPYREMNKLVENKKDKEKEVTKEKEKEKEKKKEEKKEEKKVEVKKDLKTSITTNTTKNENRNLTKTPMKSNRKKELDFKGKTEVLPKKSRVFSGKSSHKPELNTTFQKEKHQKNNTVALTETNKKTNDRVRSSKTPLNKKEHEKEEKKENKPKKTKGISATAYKPSATKRFTSQKMPIEKKNKEKNDKKKKEIKKDIKKVNIKNKDKKEKEEKKTEEKIENKIVLKYKGLHQIPEDLRNKNPLYNIYLMLKGNYLSNKENCKLILSHPLLYKSFGSDIKFLLNDKKKELQTKINELESFLKKYDDLPNIVSSTFQPSKAAQKSLMFVTKEEIENLIKKGNVTKEFTDIFKIILYILDIKYDENLEGEELLQFFISEILVKDNKKNLMLVISEFFSKNEDLHLTKEKIEKVENIIKTDNMTLSIQEMTKKNRLISYCTFLIKEYHEFITKKTSDGIPHYVLKAKDKNLKEYKFKLATIENNGIPPKIEEVKKEENKEVKEEKKEEIKKEEKEEDNTQKIEKDDKKEDNNNNENKEVTQEIPNKENEETKVENNQDNPQVEIPKAEEQNVKSETNE